MTDDAAAASKLELDPDLVDNVAPGNCVLFFGADYPLATPGPPTRRQLADALAARYPDQVDGGQSLAEAAQQFLGQQGPGPAHADSLSPGVGVRATAGWQPTAVHQAIVSLGFDAVVTAWYDNLMEQAYRDMARNGWPR